MKYRTIMDRFGDETVSDLVIKRDLHNRWMVYGTVEHSYLSKGVALPVGCGHVIRGDDIALVANMMAADRTYIQLIDSTGIAHKVFREKKLLLYGEDGFG